MKEVNVVNKKKKGIKGKIIAFATVGVLAAGTIAGAMIAGSDSVDKKDAYVCVYKIDEYGMELYDYDENGNFIEGTGYNSYNDECAGKIQFEYDSGNKLIRQSYYETDAENSLYLIKEYEYGQNDDALGEIRQYTYDMESEQFDFEMMDVMGDGVEKPVKCMAYYIEAGEKVLSESLTIQYDEVGNVVKAEEIDQDHLNLTSMYERHIDDQGRVISVEEYRYEDDTFTGETIEFYDEEKKLIKKESYDEHGMLSGYMEFAYDRGNLIEEVSYGKDGLINYYITYGYDDMGNQISKEIIPVNSKWQEHWGVDYEYDKNGNLIKEKEWGTEYNDSEQYEYDENGNLIKHKHYVNGELHETITMRYESLSHYSKKKEQIVKEFHAELKEERAKNQ